MRIPQDSLRVELNFENKHAVLHKILKAKLLNLKSKQTLDIENILCYIINLLYADVALEVK
jgi:hypothetical protein